MLFPTSAQVCSLGRRSFELNFNANISAFRGENRMRHNIPSIGGTRKMRRRKEEIWTSPFPPHQKGGGVKVNTQAEEEEDAESTLFFSRTGRGSCCDVGVLKDALLPPPPLSSLSIPSFLSVVASPTLPYGSSSECRQSWEEGGKRELGKRSFSLPPPYLQHSFAFFSQSFLALSFARQQQEEQSNQSNERGH